MKPQAIIMIIHYTYGWTQQCVESFFSYFPHRKMIVFNNNPFPNQEVNRTRGGTGLNPRWDNLCQEETEYVRNHPNITVVEVPREFNKRISQLPSHGEVLDFAFDRCQKSGYHSLLHIEPDCKINGNEWLKNMTQNLKNKWVVGNGALCPTLWDINSILELGMSFKKNDDGLNTAIKIMALCRSQGKFGNVSIKGFIHFHKGTRKIHNVTFL